MDELIPIDEVILVKEASLDVPYHDIKTAYEFIARCKEAIPPIVTELLKVWGEFLAENY